MPDQSLFSDHKALNLASLIIRAVDHELRQNICHLIDNAKENSLADLAEKLDLDPDKVEQHLHILSKAGITQPNGSNKKYYSLDHQRISAINDAIKILAE